MSKEFYRGYQLVGLKGDNRRVAIFHDDEPVDYADTRAEARETIDGWLNAR